ncbi:MAG: hypothetical protein K8S23_03405 [Candidatus Cloacimonetes bacterium]|nr:hypothetical protein [Candidatus Cloacimonadota bacterium]
MNKIILLSLISLTLFSCSVTYYLGQFKIEIIDSYHKERIAAIKNIKQIANDNLLYLDSLNTNNDTLAFYGPPYNYIQFLFSENSSQNSLIIKFDYDGRLSDQETTDKIYFNFVNHLKTIYQERINYKLLKSKTLK